MPINAKAVSEFMAKYPNTDPAALNSYLESVDSPAPAAPESAAPSGPPAIPGMGDPSGVAKSSAKSAPPAQNMRVADARAMGEWDRVELKCREVAGIAAAEVKAAHEAYERYDDFVSDNYAVLADNWIERATERDAAALAEFVNAGKPVPKTRESEVDKAIRARPLALATARKLRDDVHKADEAAKAAFRREAPAALPRMRKDVAGALADAERALADFVRAVVNANAIHGDVVKVRGVVEKIPAPIVQSMSINLVDAHSALSLMSDAIQNARRRVGPVGDDE